MADPTYLIAAPEAPLALAAKAVPDTPHEMDFVPTHRNVNAGPSSPPTLMLIEGSGSDQGKMDEYRDIIFAISRWPEAHRALSFWLSKPYQDDAIPLRLGIGAFSVLTFEGERGG